MLGVCENLSNMLILADILRSLLLAFDKLTLNRCLSVFCVYEMTIFLSDYMFNLFQ